MEYVIGPILALLISMKFTDWRASSNTKLVKETEAKIELLESELPKKMVATMMPVAKAVNKINGQLGL